jgi:hypothetical protein
VGSIGVSTAEARNRDQADSSRRYEEDMMKGDVEATTNTKLDRADPNGTNLRATNASNRARGQATERKEVGELMRDMDRSTTVKVEWGSFEIHDSILRSV